MSWLTNIIKGKAALKLQNSTEVADAISAAIAAFEVSDLHVHYAVDGSVTLAAATGSIGTLNVTPNNTAAGASVIIEGARAGNIYTHLNNTDSNTTANALSVFMTAAGAGDPYQRYTVGSVASWAVGCDNSDSDAFVIASAGSAAAVLGTTNRIRIDRSTGEVSVVNRLVAKSSVITIVALTDASTVATDASLSNNFRVTLGGNRTLGNPTNMADGMVFNWKIKQDATGSRTLNYGSKFKWPGGSAPVLSTAANAIDVLSAVYDGTDDILLCAMQKGFA